MYILMSPETISGTKTFPYSITICPPFVLYPDFITNTHTMQIQFGTLPNMYSTDVNTSAANTNYDPQQNLELYLVATGFLILEGDNLSNLFPDMDFSYRIGAKSGFIVLVALIILPTIWLHNMNILSYISASGVIASMIILGSVFWDGAVDGVGFQEKGRVVNWSGIPSAISLYAFCYCAHPVFPTLYTSMRNQRQFSKVLFLCLALSTFAYSLMAVIRYLMYGSNVESQITLNLPTNNISSRVAICTTLITPIAKYALMLKPIVDSIEARFHASYNKRIFSFFIRTILMLSTVIVALSLPFFGYLMSLVGALLSATTL
ncbi:putative amino acid transporter, transmembrane domain-containing protein [Helianthus anomalus]